MSITISSTISSPAVAPGSVRANPVRDQVREGGPASVPEDTVTLGKIPESSGTYGDPRIRTNLVATKLETILAESESKAQAIMNLIAPMIEQQAISYADVISGKEKLNADPATIESAKAAIADDGEFGVQQVANRILDFARAAIGDDPSKIAKFRAAVENGFKQAADMLGGKLPEISEKTRTVMMETFDRWETEGFGEPQESKAAATS